MAVGSGVMPTLTCFLNLGCPDSFWASESIAAGDAAPVSQLQTGMGAGGRTSRIRDGQCYSGDHSYHFYFEEFPLLL